MEEKEAKVRELFVKMLEDDEDPRLFFYESY